MTKIYLAGPMSGHPQFNFPLFDRVAAELRGLGFDVVSPHECDSPETQAMARASADGIHTGAGESWGTCLARDVKMIADDGIEAIVFLPGWQKSRGAKLEATIGLLCRLSFFLYVARDGALGTIVPVPDDIVRSSLYRHL